MRDADGRCHLLDVLAAVPGRVVDVDTDVVVFYVDFCTALDFRQHLDQREGGMARMGRIEGGETDETMDTALAAQQAVGVVPANLHRGALDPGLLTQGRVEDV